MSIIDNSDKIIKQIQKEAKIGEYTPLKFVTARGRIAGRYYQVENSYSGVIYVGGVGGGFDTPANELYPYLSEKFKREGISSLRIRFRNSRNLEEAVYDVIAGIKFLEKEGISKIALVGHSFGGAVVIQAAELSSSVKTVVTLATQSHGAENVSLISSDTSILLIHGAEDNVLPSFSSKRVFDIAHETKKMIILPDNGHCLDESAIDVKDAVYNWILNQLNK